MPPSRRGRSPGAPTTPLPAVTFRAGSEPQAPPARGGRNRGGSPPTATATVLPPLAGAAAAAARERRRANELLARRARAALRAQRGEARRRRQAERAAVQAAQRTRARAAALGIPLRALAAPTGPADYAAPGGKLAALLARGVILLARSDALLALAGYRKTGVEELYGVEVDAWEQTEPCGRIMPRQAAPESMFHPPGEAVRRWAASQAATEQLDDWEGHGAVGLWLHAVSYCWTGPRHPDPDGFHLRRLARVLLALRKLRAAAGLPADVGVFWDFVSLPQWDRTPPPAGVPHPHPWHGDAGQIGRSRDDEHRFGLALADMQLLYGHAHSVVLKLTAMPEWRCTAAACVAAAAAGRPGGCPHVYDAATDRFTVTAADGVTTESKAWLYRDRGWPFFESSVADASARVHGSRLAFGADLDGLAGVYHGDQLAERFRAKGAPPVHPRRFEAELARRAFTNGSDAAMVAGLYRRTFASMARAPAVDLGEAGLDDAAMPTLLEALAEYRELATLNLGSNALTAVPAALCQLRQLTELNLGSNALTAVPAALCQLRQLTELNLSGNALAAVPAELGQLRQLTTLRLYRNALMAVPAELGQLRQLTELNLGFNALTVVPPELGQLRQLTTLYLNGNALAAVPAELGQLRQLTTLDLGSNALTAVPAELGQLRQLTELGLSDNALAAVPAELGQLRQLRLLDLISNALTAVPAELGQLRQLTYLNLSSNKLAVVPAELGQLRQLNTLDLSDNAMAAVPAELGQLRQLVMLDLSDNALTAVPAEVEALAAYRGF